MIQRFLLHIDRSVEWTMATLESIGLAILTRLATWVAPVPSAVVVSRSAADTLNLSFGYAVCIAIALEVVGIAAVHQWLEAREWNATKRAKEPMASELAGRLAVIAYVVIAELMIVTFELKAILEDGQPWGLTAIPLPLLTFIIVLIANERMMMHERRKARVETQQTMTARCSFAEFSSKLQFGDSPGVPEIMETCGVSERTAYAWLSRLRRNGGSNEAL